MSRKAKTQRVALTQCSKQPKKPYEVEDGNAACIMCGEEFQQSVAGESWIQCKKCKGWCRDECSAGESSSGFVCDFCTELSVQDI